MRLGILDGHAVQTQKYVELFLCIKSRLLTGSYNWGGGGLLTVSFSYI